MWDLNRLRLLHELHLRGTITEVARVLAYSPSSVSHQLAVLQREVGVRLLEPAGRKVRLTPHGVMLADHARRVMELEERMHGALERARQGPQTVRVALLETVATALLPAVLDELDETAPEVRLEVSVLPPEDGLFELIARGFDLAFAEQYPGHTRPHHPGLDRVRLGLDPIHAATAPSQSATSLAELADRAWVLEPEGTAARDWASQQCRAAGFEPDVQFETPGLDSHLRLIATGRAVGFLPALALDATVGSPGTVRAIELAGSPQRELFTSARRSTQGRPGVAAVRAAFAARWPARHAPG